MTHRIHFVRHKFQKTGCFMLECLLTILVTICSLDLYEHTSVQAVPTYFGAYCIQATAYSGQVSWIKNYSSSSSHRIHLRHSSKTHHGHITYTVLDASIRAHLCGQNLHTYTVHTILGLSSAIVHLIIPYIA